MTRLLLVIFLIALAAGAPAYAADAPAKKALHQDKQAISQDYKTLDTDSAEIRALDKKRDDALRSNNPAAAKKIQAEIDQKRAALKDARSALKNDETDLERQKLLTAEQCAKDPACSKRKRHDELTAQLENMKKKLAFDQAIAANIPKDEEAIHRLQTELKQ